MLYIGKHRTLCSLHIIPWQDSNRLYYEPFELRVFENIGCEWRPVFFCYLVHDFLFQGNKEAVEEYSESLEEVKPRFFVFLIFIFN